MTMNGAVLPILAMYIVAAEEQVSMPSSYCSLSLYILADLFDILNYALHKLHCESESKPPTYLSQLLKNTD